MKKVEIKIYVEKNKYVVKLRSSQLKAEMRCKNIVEVDNALGKITSAFPEITFHVRFSQGALGKYTWELDSPKLLFLLGYRFMGYVGDSDIRMFYNDELSELVIIDEDGLKKYNLN